MIGARKGSTSPVRMRNYFMGNKSEDIIIMDIKKNILGEDQFQK